MSRRKCLQFQDTLITLSFDGACVVYPYNYCVWSCLLLFVCLILFLFFCFVLFFVFCHTFVFLASAFYTYWRGYVGKTNEFFLHIPMGTNCVPLQALEYRINWEIYTPYAGADGMLLRINGKFTIGKLKSSLLA
jgi:hypothetical protein